MSALQLTGAGLAAALAELADRPAIAAAVRARAAALAEAVAERAGATGAGVVTRIEPVGVTVFDVVIAGESLRDREFGTLAEPAKPLIAEAIAAVTRRA